MVSDKNQEGIICHLFIKMDVFSELEKENVHIDTENMMKRSDETKITTALYEKMC